MTTKKKSTKKASATKAPKAKAAKSAVKAVKSKAPKAPKEPKVNSKRKLIEDPKFSLSARDGEKSGNFIKRLLETNALTTAEIVEAVQDNFPDSKVSGSDIGFHRSKLKAAGTETSVVRVDKEGQRYTLAA